MLEKIQTTPTEPKRGPGGGVYCYLAYREGSLITGLGATARSASAALLKMEEAKEPAKAPANIGQVGWFVYNCHNGKVSYHKYILEGDRVHADTKKYYESFELIKFPLGAEEYPLPLDRLADKYPLPFEFQEKPFKEPAHA